MQRFSIGLQNNFFFTKMEDKTDDQKEFDFTLVCQILKFCSTDKNQVRNINFYI